MGPLKFCCLITISLTIALVIFLSLLAFPFVLWTPEKIYDNFGIDMRSVNNDNWRDSHWGYGILAKLKKLLPKNWGKKYQECDGNLQSPVDFDTTRVLNNSLLTPMEYYLYDLRPRGDLWNVTNNGHTVQFSAEFVDQPFISRGGLIEGRYYFRQFHFHWGANDSFGSEHTIDGKQFPLEVHLVHTKDPEEKTPYKIAVLGIFFEVASDEEDQSNLRPKMPQMFEMINSVREPGVIKQIKLPGFTLANLLPGNLPRGYHHTPPPTDQYFRYFGSLTTPPCSQFLQWTVLKTPLKISSSRLAVFRNLLAHVSHSGGSTHSDPNSAPSDDNYIHENYRPVQTVKGRVINYFGGWT